MVVENQVQTKYFISWANPKKKKKENFLQIKREV